MSTVPRENEPQLERPTEAVLPPEATVHSIEQSLQVQWLATAESVFVSQGFELPTMQAATRPAFTRSVHRYVYTDTAARNKPGAPLRFTVLAPEPVAHEIDRFYELYPVDRVIDHTGLIKKVEFQAPFLDLVQRFKVLSRELRLTELLKDHFAEQDYREAFNAIQDLQTAYGMRMDKLHDVQFHQLEKRQPPDAVRIGVQLSENKLGNFWKYEYLL